MFFLHFTRNTQTVHPSIRPIRSMFFLIPLRFIELRGTSAIAALKKPCDAGFFLLLWQPVKLLQNLHFIFITHPDDTDTGFVLQVKDEFCTFPVLYFFNQENIKIKE